MDLVGHPAVPEWDRRKEACLEALRSADADAIGLQETSPSQLRFLSAGLPEFDLWTHRLRIRISRPASGTSHLGLPCERERGTDQRGCC